MKKYLILSILLGISTLANASNFVHPMDFNGSEREKAQVIDYIKDRVRHDYCDSGIDMCNNTTLRMMEKENLKAFKELTQAQDRSILNRVINDYCNSGVNMCNYTTLNMMYNENLKASQENLSW